MQHVDAFKNTFAASGTMRNRIFIEFIIKYFMGFSSDRCTACSACSACTTSHTPRSGLRSPPSVIGLMDGHSIQMHTDMCMKQKLPSRRSKETCTATELVSFGAPRHANINKNSWYTRNSMQQQKGRRKTNDMQSWTQRQRRIFIFV